MEFCSICKNEVATVYAGGPYAGDMAGFYCDSHIPKEYQVWDRYRTCLSVMDYDFLAERCLKTRLFVDMCSCWEKIPVTG